MKFSRTLALILLFGAVYWSYRSLMPVYKSDATLSPQSFSTDRALVHIKQLSKAPHAVGTPEHAQVRHYICAELKKLGLEPTLQEGYTTGNWNVLSKVTNILARIKGSERGKALLLLSHYDSAPHSAYGASDAASGVAALLEGLRAFLSDTRVPKNDIIILISDAEELGLNGAHLFVHQHPWAEDVGLVLNFEARGSGGPSFTLLETNRGNGKLIELFAAAHPQYPVANSLAYSVYKMLPNDTDLTVFREDGDIEGFNFAFIDDHFDYHTALDTYERLDRNSLAHQGSYLMPLLRYGSTADLSDLKTLDDYVYFNLPFLRLVSYPFAWIWPLLGVAVLAFVLLLVLGFKHKRIRAPEVLKGFLPLLWVLSINGTIGFFSWTAITWVYPAFNDMLQGFTYNGYTYILVFVLLSLAVCFKVYHRFRRIRLPNLLVAPLLVWLLLCGLLAVYLEGASFFIVPVFGLLVAFALSLYQDRPNPFLLVVLALPAVCIHVPLIVMFPVGLGLKMMVTATLLTTLLFLLTLPFFGLLKRKNRLAYLALFLAVGCSIVAHTRARFTAERPKPSSLLYLYNADTHAAFWATYDQSLIDWNRQFLGTIPSVPEPRAHKTFSSKYRTQFTYRAKAPFKPLATPEIAVQQDTVQDGERLLTLSITPKRNVYRLDVYTNLLKVSAAQVNQIPLSEHVLKNRGERLITHVITDNTPTELQLRFPKDSVLELTFYEVSYDLLTHPAFTVPERPKHSIPMPFVINDAIVVTQTLRFE